MWRYEIASASDGVIVLEAHGGDLGHPDSLTMWDKGLQDAVRRAYRRMTGSKRKVIVYTLAEEWRYSDGHGGALHGAVVGLRVPGGGYPVLAGLWVYYFTESEERHA